MLGLLKICLLLLVARILEWLVSKQDEVGRGGEGTNTFDAKFPSVSLSD